jgi:glycosyltransferase involved in cell wall biosynthesis
LTLLEAMACGRPVVVTDVGGNPEIVREEVDGLRVPRGDSVSMAAAIERLAGDARQGASFGASARQRVCDVFDQSSAIRQFARLFEELSPAGRRGAGT